MQGQFQKFLEFRKQHMGAEIDQDAVRKLLDTRDDSPIRLTLGPRRSLWQLMLGGVFDRHPELRLMLTEVRADWLPATLAHLDRRCDEFGSSMRRRPSEYFASNCGVAPSSPHRAEIEMRHEIGVERFRFGVDYPHPEGTGPTEPLSRISLCWCDNAASLGSAPSVELQRWISRFSWASTAPSRPLSLRIVPS